MDGFRHPVDPPRMLTATPDSSIEDQGALPSDVADFA